MKPDGVDEDAPAYLNAVVLVRSALHPRELLAALQRGRGGSTAASREERWGDRTLDIDIVSLGGFRVDDPELTVPHPRARERAFVLAPWLDVEPDAAITGADGRVERVDALLAATGETPTRYDAEPLL